MPVNTKISVIIPCYNEEEVILTCYERIRDVIEKINYEFEIVFVNDGSSDKTADIVTTICAQNPNVLFVDLSRNFGKEAAMSAGLDISTGEAVIILDADLQDPPDLFPEFILLWEQGYDNVYGKRIGRDGESWIKKLTAKLFYRLIKSVSNVDIPENVGDFRLLSRQAVEALKAIPERRRFMKGLFAWVGFNTIEVEYKRHARVAGDTKWNYWKLWNFALEGITSFTTLPLRLASYIGALISFFAFIYAFIIIFRTIFYGIDVGGYASQMVAMLFLGGLQLAFLGIIGEYLGRIYDESKHRPLYLVKRVLNPPLVLRSNTNGNLVSSPIVIPQKAPVKSKKSL
jgi:glycosyltransferase involved in cell wall biosynthesis